MLRILLSRRRQGHQTSRYPKEPPQLPDRFRGLHSVDITLCEDGCNRCSEVCPTDAIDVSHGETAIDLGRCLFCGECSAACSAGALRHTANHRMAATLREGLVVRSNSALEVKALARELRRLLGRSLKLRQVSAGGCNACEADVNVLGTLTFDLARFGIQFVTSPRHADGLLITGPVTENMRLALQKTYDAVPAPKIVIACGACAISGGPYAGHSEQHDGAASVVPVDLYVPGCPPHPYTILEGLLGLLDRLPRR